MFQIEPDFREEHQEYGPRVPVTLHVTLQCQKTMILVLQNVNSR